MRLYIISSVSAWKKQRKQKIIQSRYGCLVCKLFLRFSYFSLSRFFFFLHIWQFLFSLSQILTCYLSNALLNNTHTNTGKQMATHTYMCNILVPYFTCCGKQHLREQWKWDCAGLPLCARIRRYVRAQCRTLYNIYAGFMSIIVEQLFEWWMLLYGQGI